MKFQLPKEQAKKCISYVNGVTGESLVLMSANKNKKKACFEGASNGVYVRVDYTVDPDEEGIIAVNGTHLGTIKFPTEVNFNAPKDENNNTPKLFFQSGSFTGEIQTETGAGYIRAQRPQVIDQPRVLVPRDILNKAISAVVFASPIKNSGIVLKVGPEGLTMHTLDGVRGSLYISQLPDPPSVSFECVMLSKVFECLKKLPGGDIYFQSDVGALRSQTDDAFLCYPKLQSEAYDVHRGIVGILQTDRAGFFKAHAKKLADTVATVTSVVRGGANYSDKLDFVVNGENLTVAIAGSATQTMILEGNTENCTFSVGAKHLQEIITMATGDMDISIYDTKLLVQSDEGKSTLLLSLMP